MDEVPHPTAQAADLHLQPFPGSDAALEFAMLGMIHRESSPMLRCSRSTRSASTSSSRRWLTAPPPGASASHAFRRS